MAGLTRVRDGTVPIAWMQEEIGTHQKLENHPLKEVRSHRDYIASGASIFKIPSP
jgi:hypothetical protein